MPVTLLVFIVSLLGQNWLQQQAKFKLENRSKCCIYIFGYM